MSNKFLILGFAMEVLGICVMKTFAPDTTIIKIVGMVSSFLQVFGGICLGMVLGYDLKEEELDAE